MGQKFVVGDDGQVTKIETDRSLANAKPKKQKKAAIDQAMDYLTYRDRTEKEMADYLAKKKYAEREIAGTMALLKQYGYVDDKCYVRQACEVNRLTRHDGRRKLKWDLKRRGIDDETLVLLEDYLTDEDEQANCEALFEAAKKRYAKERGAKKRQKILNFMGRRGFNYGMVSPLLSEIPWEDEAEDVDPQALNEELERAYVKYYNMQTRKGYDGWELKARISRNLRSRGFSGDMISERLKQAEEEGDFEDE